MDSGHGSRRHAMAGLGRRPRHGRMGRAGAGLGRAAAASGRRWDMTSTVLAGLLLRQPFQPFRFIAGDNTEETGVGSRLEVLWNMFDQVLVRPALLDRFDFKDLAILDDAGDERLVKDSGVPDRDVGSDHLPVLFRLNLRVAA